MQRTPPLPPELWDQIPPAVQAALVVIIDGYERRVTALEHEVAGLQEQRRRNSRNSSKPPSTDGLHVKRTPPKAPSGRNPGGQPGHRIHRRAGVPLEHVDAVVGCQPTCCRRCGHQLTGEKQEPVRPQVIELPPLKPHVTAYQLGRGQCERCGITTCGQLPPGVPPHCYGPRLARFIGLCSGADRMSKRKIASFCRAVLGISLAVGEVCKIEQTVKRALRPVVQQARGYVQTCHANIDETPWRERGRRRWLWTVVTEHVSVFQRAPARGTPVFRELVGKDSTSVVTSDRAKASDCHPVHRRQLCWAHRRRDFQAMIDRSGSAKTTGQILLEHRNLLFSYWHRLREKQWRPSTFGWKMSQLRRSFRRELAHGTHSRCPKTAATCLELSAREPALWTFVHREGVTPTNNAAERALRHAVLWRKNSYGTQSHKGSRFVETILTVLMTCQQQGRNLFTSLRACCQAFYTKSTPPSLLPQTSR